MRQNSRKDAGVPADGGATADRTSRKTVREIHPNAAGIDVGSREHYVAVPADRDERPVQRFGCLTPDLHAMARWLKACRVDTVAMESTGVYWIPIVQVLEQHGLEVLLVDASHVRNVPGRKTDVQDCQWLQELHSFGLLRGAFRPSLAMGVLRSYWRHREGLVDGCAQQIHLMHKALEQMNLQLHKVLSDISGVTGMRILRAILAGEHDGKELAKLRHGQVRSSEERIAQSLTGNWRAEHLFALKHAVELYDIYQEKMAECDRQIERYMAGLQPKADPKELEARPCKKGQRRRRKNQPHFDLRSCLYQVTGVDVTQIDGIDSLTAQTVLSECGYDVSAFPTEKHYVSWLGLCPNNRITGGKVHKTRTRHVQNRAAEALRVAAQSLHHSKTALGAFYRRLAARLGAAKAITATAHKLACLIYRMIKYGKDYIDQGEKHYQQRYRDQMLRKLIRQARGLGLNLISTETGALVS